MKTELRVLFYSPIAWLVLILFAVQSGFAFTDRLRDFYVSQVVGGNNYNLTLLVYRSVLGTLLDSLYLYVPLLTMGLMSREFGSGSIKLLYSSPVSNWQIIAGKYASMLVFGLGLVGILLLEVVAGFYTIENLDSGMIWVALFGFYLTFCTYAAIGLFMSTITNYQVVAALGTLAVLAVLSFADRVGQGIEVVREITGWLAVTGRTRDILGGMIGSADVLYFLLVIGLFLTLAVLKLRGERIRLSRGKLALQYGTVICAVLVCGYLTSRPVMKKYYDGTETRQNSLSAESGELMKQLKGKLTLVTYVNYLDGRNYLGMPQGRTEDLKRFEKYRCFKPDMEMKYVYYYHKSEFAYMYNVDQTLDDRTRMEKIAEIDDLDPAMFVSAGALKDEVDLAGENYRFVRRFEYENGKKAFLRIFDDMRVHPSEVEIASALKTLIEKSPVIAFSTGHGEKSPDNMSDKGYGFFAKEPAFRGALINQGYTVVTTRLDVPVDDSVDVLVVANLRQPLTEGELMNLEHYLEKGGNLLLLGEAGYRQQLEPLAALLGLTFTPDRLVQPASPYEADWVNAAVTEEIGSRIPDWAGRRNLPVVMPSSLGIGQVEDKGFQVTDVLRTAAEGVWNEKQTTDFVNEQPVLNPATGETEREYVLAKYLTRQVGEKEQRIFVLGDADCLTPAVTFRHRYNGMLPSLLFGQLTYDRFPVQVTSYPPRDNKLLVSQEGLERLKKGYIGGVPLLIFLLAGWVWFRRRRR